MGMERDVDLEQLIALGFREEQLLKALEYTDGHVEQAIDLLGGSAQRLKASPFLPASTKQTERPWLEEEWQLLSIAWSPECSCKAVSKISPDSVLSIDCDAIA